MTEIRQKTAISDKPPSLADELLQLNDDFAELSEIGTFMCHAFATSLFDHEYATRTLFQEPGFVPTGCNSGLMR